MRTRELLLRWVELAAFGSALFRSHIGLITSPNHAQVYDDENTITHFAKFAGVFAELADYRGVLMGEAESRGWPLIRHMAAHYSYDSRSWELVSQFMFGEDFLIAPVLDPAPLDESLTILGVRNSLKYSAMGGMEYSAMGGMGLLPTKVKVYLPQHSSWVHLWSGQTVEGGADGRFVSVDAPIQAPPVFYRPESVEGQRLRQWVVEQGMEVDVLPSSHTDTHTDTDTGDTKDTGDTGDIKDADMEDRDAGQAEGQGQTEGTEGQGSRACMRPITDFIEPDWYDWLGIKQYVSVSPFGTTQTQTQAQAQTVTQTQSEGA
jgi:alpha-glucosidase (family GH31 glycosyl hydrolase)